MNAVCEQKVEWSTCQTAVKKSETARDWDPRTHERRGTLEPMYKEHSQQQADKYEVLLKVLKSSQSSNRYKEYTKQPSATKQRK